MGSSLFILKMDLNVETLINAVYSHSPLWDMRDRRYHIRDLQKRLWTQVAEEVGADGKWN